MANIEVDDLIDLSDEQKTGIKDVPETPNFVEDNCFDQLLNEYHGINEQFDVMHKGYPKSPNKEVKTAQLLPLFNCETEELQHNSDDGSAKDSDSMENVSFHSAISHLSKEYQQFPFLKLSKQDSCDDIMSTTPPWRESDSDIDSDLEMFKMPAVEKWKNDLEEQLKQKTNLISSVGNIPITIPRVAGDSPSTDLHTIKERFEHLKNQLQPNLSTVENLKGNIIKIIAEGSNGDEKVKEANKLLESLCAILSKPTEKADSQALHLKDKREDLPQTNSPFVSSTGAAYSIENTSPINPDLMEKIQEVFGSGTVANVASSAVGNPAIIVVMGTPVPPVAGQASKISTHVGDASPDFSGSRLRPQTKSLSTPYQADKFLLRRTSLKTPSSNVVQESPAKLSTPNLASVRRSIYTAKPSENILRGNPDNLKKRSSTASGIENRIAKLNECDENAVPKKLKIKTREVGKETRGPLKATIPINKITSTLATQCKSSPNKDNLKPSRSSFCRISPRLLTQRSPSATPNPRSTSDSVTLPRRRTNSELNHLEKTVQSAKGSNRGRLEIKPSSQPTKRWSYAKTVRTVNT